MPIEIRELVIRVQVEGPKQKHATFRRESLQKEININALKSELQEYCNELVESKIERLKER